MATRALLLAGLLAASVSAQSEFASPKFQYKGCMRADSPETFPFKPTSMTKAFGAFSAADCQTACEAAGATIAALGNGGCHCNDPKSTAPNTNNKMALPPQNYKAVDEAECHTPCREGDAKAGKCGGCIDKFVYNVYSRVVTPAVDDPAALSAAKAVAASAADPVVVATTPPQQNRQAQDAEKDCNCAESKADPATKAAIPPPPPPVPAATTMAKVAVLTVTEPCSDSSTAVKPVTPVTHIAVASSAASSAAAVTAASAKTNNKAIDDPATRIVEVCPPGGCDPKQKDQVKTMTTMSRVTEVVRPSSTAAIADPWTQSASNATKPVAHASKPVDPPVSHPSKPADPPAIMNAGSALRPLGQFAELVCAGAFFLAVCLS
ncbi:hypothetical protein JDV02_002099 [Purpureocillium takamizusanense]|uniref:WSC domain-containing protein n=1 Tax=Purpureocillium takamizusanense TaxID=2060973 RepID=A0A9Q8V739_9HYPO|nr:uncharacterized protein JDV02_002099 [Purpureocillium takamizusanense]UNI15575.1 hypothetical protein JDV02_002099 [Purpureocillium takamizusanense]